MSWTFCTSTQAIEKAGENANTTITADTTALGEWSDEVEDKLCVIAGVDLIGLYATMTTNGKKLLQQYCTADIAERIMAWAPSEYGNAEFTNMINVLENQKKEIEVLLKDRNYALEYLGAK